MDETDIVIVGSGPIGSIFANQLFHKYGDIRITMIEAGPKISNTNGLHTKNMLRQNDINTAQRLSQGPFDFDYPSISISNRMQAIANENLNHDVLARAGTHLAYSDDQDLKLVPLPAAAHSTNIGGMGVHWTCACPRAGYGEAIPWWSGEELDYYYTKAEKLLDVNNSVFLNAEMFHFIFEKLNAVYGRKHFHRPPQLMPLACKVESDGVKNWTGTDRLLQKLEQSSRFTLIPNTIATKLEVRNNIITQVNIKDRESKLENKIKAKIFILAGDAMRTPQLLWASGIRPIALGHYLNEHPFIFCTTDIDTKINTKNELKQDPLAGVYWVPFDIRDHRFHGQIMHMDLSPLKAQDITEASHVLGLGWACQKELKFEDWVEFDDNNFDFMGLPKMKFNYTYSKTDLENIQAAFNDQARVLEIFGQDKEKFKQVLMPAGYSLHYTGTIRMGLKDDDTSVCDQNAKVWNIENLYLGGNGTIPTAMASNPTLTSAAIAIRSCDNIKI